MQHIREVDKTALDIEIIALALETDAVILTADKDFGKLIAESRMARPSVILFRLTPAPTEVIVKHLEPILSNHQEQLRQGCLITVGLGKPRLRNLPLT